MNGTLGLSRSFGDFEYKCFSKKAVDEQPVISVPEVLEMERRKEDDFILLGCDGVWERYVSSNQKMVNTVKELLDKYKDRRHVLEKLFDNLVAKELK